MRLLLIILSTICLTLATSQHTLGQNVSNDDIVILSSGDTLRGIALTYNGEKKYSNVTFITTDKSKIDFIATDIKELQLSNNLRYELNPKSGLLWQVLVKGGLSLYKNEISYYLKNKEGTEFTLNDKVKEFVKNGSNIRKKNSSWRKELAKATSDCVLDTRLYAFVKFTDEDLTKFIDDYNKCKNSRSQIFSSDRSKLKIRYGLTTGFHTIKSNATPRSENSLLQEALGNSENLEIGISAEIYFQNTFERIVFSPELIYRKVSTLLTETYQFASNRNAIIHNDIYYNASFISLPLSVKYSLNRTYPKFYIKGGGILDYSLSNDIEAFQEVDENGIVLTSTTEIDVLPELFFGFGVGFGSQLNFGNLKANIEAQFQNAYTNEINAIFQVTHQRIGLSLKAYF